jgi:nucleotide-binding universal stress UspA family protein
MSTSKGVVMYGNVVIGIDEIDAGRDALALGRMLAARSIQLTLAHVRVLEAAVQRGNNSASEARAGDDSIESLPTEGARPVPSAEILTVLAPDVGAGLRDVAESRGADLLVIGSGRRAAIGRGLTGDDTRAVLHGAPCAVAVAPRGYRKRVKTIEIIGIGYDDSAQSGVALAHALAVSRMTGAKVVACHVMQLNVDSAGEFACPAAADVNEMAAHVRAGLGYLGDAEVRVAVGPSGESLAAFSETVDLLICGSRPHGIVRRVALGSTTDYLSRHCACPFLITTGAVPEPASSVAPDRLATA